MRAVPAQEADRNGYFRDVTELSPESTLAAVDTVLREHFGLEVVYVKDNPARFTIRRSQPQIDEYRF